MDLLFRIYFKNSYNSTTKRQSCGVTLHSSPPNTHRESTQASTSSMEQRGPRAVEAGKVIGCEGQRTPAHEAASEWSRRHLHRQHIRPLSAHGPPLLWHFPPQGQESWCGEREKHTLKGNRASLSPTLRGSAPVTWDQTLPHVGS